MNLDHVFDRQDFTGCATVNGARDESETATHLECSAREMLSSFVEWVEGNTARRRGETERERRDADLPATPSRSRWNSSLAPSTRSASVNLS